ncbi:MAG: hypothetical protein OXC80_10695 [Gammaproteobacteria bacterium]|nr:hypothetical protein [Gammaproteobacteria bacterium]
MIDVQVANGVFSELSISDSIADQRTMGTVEHSTTIEEPMVEHEFQSFFLRLVELCNLPKNWDGYKGVSVSIECATFALELMGTLRTRSQFPLPQVVPGSDGTLQLEWHQNGFDIEIDIAAPYEINASRENVNNSEKEIEEITLYGNEYTEISNWLRELSSS